MASHLCPFYSYIPPSPHELSVPERGHRTLKMPGHSATITSFTPPVHLACSDNHHPSNFNSTSSRSQRPRSQRPRPIIDSPSDTMARPIAKTEITFPITFTPTTHRISKAKKGKRVHACEFPGCSKVFTRAEHRRYATAQKLQCPLFSS